MPLARLLPALSAFLLLAAHFLHAGMIALVPVCIGLAALVFVRLPRVPLVLALALALAAGEWLRTLLMLAAARIEAGEPYLRLVIILLAVSLWTLLAALVVWSPRARRWYAAPPGG